MSADRTSAGPTPVDVAIIGAGSAAEALTRALAGTDLSVVVFERDLVGGECPFTACMPSKSLLHDARAGADWERAVGRRNRITNGLDDDGHASDLVDTGARLVRDTARITGPRTVSASGATYEAEHVVVATGAEPIVPPIDGLDDASELVWTSADALTSDERPERIVIVGAGVIGTECAFLYASFGTEVVLVDNMDRSFPDAPPEVSRVLEDSLQRTGVGMHLGVEAEAVRTVAEGDRRSVVVTLSDGTEHEADKLLVAIGRRPSTSGIGLESLGLDPREPLPLEPNGRVRCEGSVWAIGDVAGQGQYTHLANHHAAVVADHLVGTATRTFDDVVIPACTFQFPPIIQVGPQWSELHDDDDIVSVGFDLGTFPRAITDDLAAGHLWVAARRSTATVVAATGIGPQFDELVHALVIAIDGGVPVARLRQTIQPFPTVGEILGPVFDGLHDALAEA